MTDKHIARFWGKASGARAGEPAWHPLAYHNLDVAAVADRLLACDPLRLARIAACLDTEPDNARRFVVALIAMHDVGKFSPYFQAKSEETWPETLGQLDMSFRHPPVGLRHDADGFALADHLSLLNLMAPATANWSWGDIRDIWAAVAGHHGKPVSEDDAKLDAFEERPLCLAAAREFCRDVRALSDPLTPIARPNLQSLAVLTWHIASVTVVADWIGSNRAWFPYQVPKLPVAHYWAAIRTNARDAVAHANVIAATPHSVATPQRLLPEIADRLSPLQQLVADIDLPDGPSLTLIEDVTGAGKTEAAVLLAARVMAKGRADGLYFALPTMATANAMYDRLRDVYQRLYGEGERPSLVLAHGKRTLNEAFTDSILDQRNAPADDPTDQEESAATCAAWIADDRRKSLLAQVGVGTIDQALLSVLPAKHQSMRLWGLAGKILILDEIHSFDAYMSREIEALLTFHAALGGSAILLSATMPEAQRRALGDAFRKGLANDGNLTRTPDAPSDYPLMTVVTAETSTAHPVKTREDRHRALPVRRIPDFDTAVDEVVRQAEAGASVAWIRNAVDDACDAVAALEAKGIMTVLLHARFAMGDRLDIEAEVKARLGRDGTVKDREGYVVVGTQILEQSLDYDVDTMVVDLAPIDLIIQRAGRLWRHMDRKREERPRAEPELLVLSPDPGVVDDARWYHQISDRAPYVYDHHGIVWRSADVLFDAGEIVTPGGVRALVERVYGPGAMDDIPEPLIRAANEAEVKRGAARAFAKAQLLNLGAGYGGEAAIWSNDQIVATRLGEPVTTFRLAKRDGDQVVPWYLDDVAMRAWALSEVSIARRRADGVPRGDHAMAAMIEAAKADWPTWEREMPVLVLEPDEVTWRGEVELDREAKTVLYDTVRGLRFAEA
ncbi:MAG: CRISPR-associated helicase Cas3' [Pseudomonadota bacterium]